MSAVGIADIDIILFYKLLFLYFLCRINVEMAVTTAYCLIPKMFDYGKYHCRNRGADSRVTILFSALTRMFPKPTFAP